MLIQMKEVNEGSDELQIVDGESPELLEPAEELAAVEAFLEVVPAPEEEKFLPISDKVFYKEMAKIKERSKTNGGGILPPKKSASAYIIFQKEVGLSPLYQSMTAPLRGNSALS